MATYDVTTDAGKVRLLAADTNVADAVWDDDEISAFLTLANGSVYGAAALAIRSLAADRAKLAKRIEREGYKSEQFALDELAKLADSLEEAALKSGGLVVVDILEAGNGDDYFNVWRPGFRGEDDEVVE